MINLVAYFGVFAVAILGLLVGDLVHSKLKYGPECRQQCLPHLGVYHPVTNCVCDLTKKVRNVDL